MQQHDTALRPLTLADYAGQEHIKANLRIAIGAAKARGEPLDHCLFYGPPGLGKTTLAMILANEMGARCHVLHAPNIEKIADIMPTFFQLQAGDVVFIDEIHRLPAIVEEAIYPAMEDFNIHIALDEGQTFRMPLPKFTLAGATTRLGLVTSPMRTRFGIVEPLEFYPAAVLAKLITGNAGKLGLTIDAGAAVELSTRSRGTPRIANRLLRRARDVSQANGRDNIDQATALEALVAMGIDTAGLDRMDRGYLRCIADVYGGGPVGIDAIAATLGESRDTLEDAVEPYLLQRGIVARTRRGRQLTKIGMEHYRLSMV